MGWIELARMTVPHTLTGLPPRFANANLVGLESPTLRRCATEYLTHFNVAAEQGLAPLFIGPARTWKTYTAALIARLVYERGLLATEFVSCSSQLLSVDLRRFTDETRQRLRRWATVPFLVLDDFGSIDRDAFGCQVLTAIATERFNNLLPTLWTGNFDLTSGKEFSELATVYGPLLARRFEDGSTGYRVITQ